ncbi:hypothetical protein [Streptomyces alboflavus]|uniref:hypothetical protein n=1 Tax=Streptomyces alboflavus TaxID=67267 RepID=UPI001331BA77|nr:hypothetical protein [Streptomyces alboflavus]
MSGERVERPTVAGLAVLADVMCARCQGCGRDGHGDCPEEGVHGGGPPYDQGTRLASHDPAWDEVFDPHGVCGCHQGRGFYFHMVHRRAPGGAGWVMAVLRVPCACQMNRARVVTAAGSDIEVQPMWPKRG